MTTGSYMSVDLAIAAAGWNYLGTGLRIVSQLAAQIALARLVGPDAFGIMALTVLPVALGSLAAELGLGSALVQKRDLGPDEFCSVWSRTALAGLVITVLLFLAAPAISLLLGEPRMAPVLRSMAPVVLLNALSVVPLAKLKRELDLKRVQLAQLGGYLTGFVGVGILAAWGGAGVWALVAAWLTFSAVSLLLALRFSGLRLRFAAPLFMGGDTGRFGRSILLTNISNWAVENLDNLVVGRLFGARQLGLYSVSYNLVRTPANHLVQSLQAALFPASARAFDNPALLKRGYLAVVCAVSLVAFPLFLTVAALSHSVVLALFGSQWQAAGSVLMPLSLAMACHCLMAVAGPVLAGKGRPEIELRVQVWTGLLFVGVLFAVAGSSVQVVAWAVLAVYLLRVVWMTSSAVRELQIPAGSFFRTLRGPVVLASFVLGAVLAVESILLWQSVTSALFCLSASLVTATLLVIALVWLWPGFFLVADLRAGVARICETHPFLKGVSFVRRIAQAE